MCPSTHVLGPWGRKRMSCQPSQLHQCHCCGFHIWTSGPENDGPEPQCWLLDYLYKQHLWESFLKLSPASPLPYTNTQQPATKLGMSWRSGTWFEQCSKCVTHQLRLVFSMYPIIFVVISLFVSWLLPTTTAVSSSKAHHKQYLPSQLHKGTNAIIKCTGRILKEKQDIHLKKILIENIKRDYLQNVFEPVCRTTSCNDYNFMFQHEFPDYCMYIEGSVPDDWEHCVREPLSPEENGSS